MEEESTRVKKGRSREGRRKTKDTPIKALKTFQKTAIALFVTCLAGGALRGKNGQTGWHAGSGIFAGAGALSVAWDSPLKGMAAARWKRPRKMARDQRQRGPGQGMEGETKEQGA